MSIFSNPILKHIPLPQQQADVATVVQISDLHLFENPTGRIGQIYQENFNQVLAMIQTYPEPIDLLVVTGDLVHEISPANYDKIFAQLDSLNLPYICIAGNHDVTQELDPELPFEQRRHMPMSADSRLASCVTVNLPQWDVLLLNSSVAGQIYGTFDEATLMWLKNQLETLTKPCVIFTHHPMVTVNSAWIDNHRLQNADEFWKIVTPHADKLKGIFVGHIHQEHHVIHNGIPLYSTPATSVQFAPFHDQFTIDTQKTAGLRRITLYNNATLATDIKRIDTM